MIDWLTDCGCGMYTCVFCIRGDVVVYGGLGDKDGDDVHEEEACLDDWGDEDNARR